MGMFDFLDPLAQGLSEIPGNVAEMGGNVLEAGGNVLEGIGDAFQMNPEHAPLLQDPTMPPEQRMTQQFKAAKWAADRGNDLPLQILSNQYPEFADRFFFALEGVPYPYDYEPDQQ